MSTFITSCVDCLEIWVPQPPGTLRALQACNGIALHVILMVVTCIKLLKPASYFTYNQV
jgi:hypothetical protein